MDPRQHFIKDMYGVYWANIAHSMENFIKVLLNEDTLKRMTSR
jgi:hypothetical protein